MAADEAKTTNSVSIYYASVNVDGIQYSARMVVKKLKNHGVVIGDLSMYNMDMHKEKTPTNTGLNSPQSGLGSYSAGVSGYKVKDLIHSTQENDQKLLGITDINGLRFSKVGSPKPENTSPDIVEALKNAGLDVRTYDNTGTEDQKDANRTQATMDAVQGRDDIMFQKASQEKIKRIEKLRNSESASIKGDEITPDPDIKVYRKNALEYGKQHLRGSYKNDDTGNEITLGASRRLGGLRELHWLYCNT